MSIAAMNWAWRQQLAPTAKLVLMSLADAADDHGVCWPSVPTVARKCCVSARTVRRIMHKLVDRDLLVCEPRYRPDGSCSSNRYRLPLAGGDKLSRPHDQCDSTPCRQRQGLPDSRDSPGTTKGTPSQSPQPPTTANVLAASESAGASGEEPAALIYPKGLSASERAQAKERLANLPAGLAQQLLDELAGRMKAGAIKVAALAYLRGLISKAHAGEFTPEMALRVAETRNRRRQAEAALQRREAVHNKSLRRDTFDANSPLVQRLAAIKEKARRCNRRK